MRKLGYPSVANYYLFDVDNHCRHNHIARNVCTGHASSIVLLYL